LPKETFFNLADEKKKRIFDAAVSEFALRRFSEASINNIVKAALVPRGSFYQYFNDKEDIYLYMLNEIGKEKLSVMGNTLQSCKDADFFDTFVYMFEAALKWSKTKPEYYRIGMLMLTDESDFIIKLRDLSEQGFQMFKNLVVRDQNKGLIKKDIDPTIIIDLIYSANLYLSKALQNDLSEPELLKRLHQMLTIIKHGIAEP